MNNIELNKKLDEIFEDFEQIFNQQMELQKAWEESQIPKETIIRMMTIFAVDLACEEYGRESAHQYFHNMIENYEDPLDLEDIESSKFYN
jgi:hypothetical protein